VRVRREVEVAAPRLVFPETVSAVLEAKPRVEDAVTLIPAKVAPPVKMGEPLKTKFPVPVSSVTSAASSEEESIDDDATSVNADGLSCNATANVRATSASIIVLPRITNESFVSSTTLLSIISFLYVRS
jgi:hypothetical protein